ncbi:hypothetical protein FSP39_025411 [Pinctada imbricata]|uniref:Peptidase S1 domain-containing protein n=1 Tax=Pinctada imbricata TaxID=66713 RepID=A0AA89C3D7_PINIB|nr:hypothetical protein FSP39_025411 [Pinctada imbricata]
MDNNFVIDKLLFAFPRQFFYHKFSKEYAEKQIEYLPHKPDFEARYTVKRIAERPPGSPIGGKISFGFRSVPGGHPYLVSIRKIIGRGRNRRVPLRASDIVIRVGEYDLTVRDGPERDYNVREIITPNTFDRSTYETDISLLYIEGRGIQLRRGIIDLAELPSENIRVSPNDRCFVSGWGDTEQGPSNVVREAQLKYFNPGEQARCQNLYRSQREVTRSMFCAGTDDGVPRDTCLGDSGGPFICQINGRRMLIGITSWGVRECGRPFYPGVYTDVRVLRQWIRNNAGI